MNRFSEQLEQSQNDAELYRWKCVYTEHFSSIPGWEVYAVINTDTLDNHAEWQSKGVDHIVKTNKCDIYIDFMLREQTYPDFFLEYEVNGKPGKFCREDLITNFIAYSYRHSPCVYLFTHKEARFMVSDILAMPVQKFRHKTSTSVNGGRKWETKGVIVPHNHAFKTMGVRKIML